MAKRGRPRKSDELRRAQGLRGNRPIPPVVAAPVAPAPVPVEPPARCRPPSWLPKPARDVWATIAPQLLPLRLLSEADAVPFGRYCGWLAEFLAIQKKRSKTRGTVVRTHKSRNTEGMQRIDQTFNALLQLDKRLTDYEDRFGMNPRERLAIMAKLAGASPGHVPPQPRAPAPTVADGKPGAPPINPPAPSSSPVGFLNTLRH